MTGQVTARRAALDRVEQEQERLGRWQAEQAAAEAELTDLQGRAGDEVLADPDAAAALTEAMTGLRSRIDIAARAVTAAEPRVDEARRAVLLVDAGEWDEAAAGLRAQLDEREQRTAELLAALEEYTGAKWQLAPLLNATTGMPSLITSRDVTAERLRVEVASAERTGAVLRALAAGEDPEKTVPGVTAKDYPASVWGPAAVLPAPRYLVFEQERQRRVAAARGHLAEAEARVVELRQRKAAGDNVDEWLHRTERRIEELRGFLDRENVGA